MICEYHSAGMRLILYLTSTSFGYFDDPSEDLKVVNNIYSALKPGGVLVMDYINSVAAESIKSKQRN